MRLLGKPPFEDKPDLEDWLITLVMWASIIMIIVLATRW